MRNAPDRKQRSSRFYGSHTGPAWAVLGMISLVVITLLLYRGAQYQHRALPVRHSRRRRSRRTAVAKLLGDGAYNQGIETFFLLAQMAVIFGFTILVVYSKHLHIATAPLNVLTKREPDGLRALLPVDRRRGRADRLRRRREPVRGHRVRQGQDRGLHLEGLPRLRHLHRVRPLPVAVPGVEHRQAALAQARDHGPARSPVREGAVHHRRQDVPGDATAEGKERAHVPEAGFPRIEGSGPDQAVRPLVGDLASGGVIDPDVLWSCTTCGACVEQCPVDIEHIDHIVDMRRYQVLIESAFPSEAGVMLRNIENKGNPWGMADKGRDEWMADLSFEVRRAEPGTKLDADIEYLFWVGCAGALEDRSRKVTIAFAELLHTAGVEFAVLGSGETCTGDPARRLGNEFLFQMQGMQNVETLNSITRAGAVEDRRDLPALLQHAGQRVPAARRALRGRAPHAAARPAGRRGPADAGRAGRQERHLPRPVLPRPAQQGLHAAARGARRDPGAEVAGDAPLQGARLLLRRRRRAVLDGGEDRQADQRRAHRRGARASIPT